MTLMRNSFQRFKLFEGIHGRRGFLSRLMARVNFLETSFLPLRRSLWTFFVPAVRRDV